MCLVWYMLVNHFYNTSVLANSYVQSLPKKTATISDELTEEVSNASVKATHKYPESRACSTQPDMVT